MTTSPRKVLYVDADESAAASVSLCLGDRNYEVTHESTPDSVLSELRTGAYRVVILSIDPHGPVNSELLIKIKQQDGALQVIVIMPPDSVTKALDAMRNGAEACLLKPLREFNSLAEALERAFEKVDRWWLVLAKLSRSKKMARSSACTP